MPNPAIAQLILSLATTPDRAATTVGDLLEESDTRGSLWFWSSVLGTVGSLCWRDFRSAPLRIIGVGLWGSFAAPILAAAPTILLSLGLANGFPGAPVPFMWSLFLVVSEVIAAIIVGWDVAQRSKGRELAAACSVAFTVAVFYSLAEYGSAMQVHRVGQNYPGREHALAEDCLEVALFLLSAILFRLASTSRRPSPHAN